MLRRRRQRRRHPGRGAASRHPGRGGRLAGGGCGPSVSIVAVVVWLIAAGLFALYVVNFGHYNKVYGSIAAVIIFLSWLWISNAAGP
jgi:hypothetical protein